MRSALSILERPRSDNVRRVVATVALLFTDIEGSTRLWERDAAAMAPALARHDELLRGVIEEHGGRVFKTVGDAFCAAFAGPRDAVAAARAGQAALAAEPWPDAARLRVRMAVHLGECEQRDGDYFGAAAQPRRPAARHRARRPGAR